MVGWIGTPGHSSAASRATACITSGCGGEGGAAIGRPLGVIVTLSSAMTRARMRAVSSTGSSGRMRQFTVARAICGSAFSTVPASSSVATQVVRICAL